MTTTTICECGHAERIHSVLEGTECRACACVEFTRALDPDAATEAARSHQERRERTYRALRRAVANHRLDLARDLLDELTGAGS